MSRKKIPEQLRQDFKEIRAIFGLSMADMSRLCDVPPDFISRLEKGITKSVDAQLLARIDRIVVKCREIIGNRERASSLLIEMLDAQIEMMLSNVKNGKVE
ncbi:hypothetical protein ACFL35_00145 [Candidatus Riflebacteria bacterium]